MLLVLRSLVPSVYALRAFPARPLLAPPRLMLIILEPPREAGYQRWRRTPWPAPSRRTVPRLLTVFLEAPSRLPFS